MFANIIKMCGQSAAAVVATATNWFWPAAHFIFFGQNEIAASGTQCRAAAADCDAGYLMRIERHFK